MFSMHGRWLGPGLLVVMLMMASTGLGGVGGQEEQDGQPTAGAVDKEHRLTTRRSDPGSVWYTLGNLSVNLLADAWGSPIAALTRKSNRLQELMPTAQITGPRRAELESLGGRLTQLMNAQRFEEASRVLDRMLEIAGQRGDLPRSVPGAGLARGRNVLVQQAHADGANGVEDYVGWAVVEPKAGHWDWSAYQENAREIRKAGLKYVPYVWVQNLPSWVRRGADYRFATCLEHGKPSEYLSVFSPKTVEAYDRVFAQLKAALGTQIDALRIGSPCDYGETHYPAGAASQAFPVAHVHMGWWAGEPEARQHFLRWVEKKYNGIDRLNAAWRTQFTGFEFDYPRDPTSPRRWLDFVEWYHEALIERLGVLFDVARKHFPETPICTNLGWPFEKIVLGQDLSGLVKMLASRKMIVRTPTGPMVTHLYTRRVSTAARFYHPAGLSTEPVDGSAPLNEIAGALFKDLTTGATWHFDYPQNMERGRESFRQARSLPRHDYPRIDAAIFFSTTAHRLENWDNWREGFGGGYPEGMAPWLEGLRDILDYDVVDERLIDDGALRLPAADLAVRHAGRGSHHGQGSRLGRARRDSARARPGGYPHRGGRPHRDAGRQRARHRRRRPSRSARRTGSHARRANDRFATVGRAPGRRPHLALRRWHPPVQSDGESRDRGSGDARRTMGGGLPGTAREHHARAAGHPVDRATLNRPRTGCWLTGTHATRNASVPHRDGASRRMKTFKPSNSAVNGFVDEFTAATPILTSSGRRTSSGGNVVQLTPSWLADA